MIYIDDARRQRFGIRVRKGLWNMKQKITGKEKLLETLERLMEKFPHLRAQLETTWRRLKEQKNGASNG